MPTFEPLRDLRGARLAQTPGPAAAIDSPTAGVPHRRRRRAIGLAALGLATLLAAMSVAVVRVQNATRHRANASLTARGVTSAQFISTYLSQQAERETQTGARYFTARHVSAKDFNLVVSGFGSDSAGLLDSSGRVLDILPVKPGLIGSQLGSHYAHLRTAESGRAAVSGVVRSVVHHIPVVAIAVPFATPAGRRVLSITYAVAGTAMNAFVAHTIAYPQHRVFIIDATGSVVTASPRTTSSTLAAADPTLARAIVGASQGAVHGSATPTSFTITPIAGTSWRMVIAVPDRKLFASAEGWSKWLPWTVVAAVSTLALIMLLLFSRFLTFHDQLGAVSKEMEHAAGTDPVSGLANRRWLANHLVSASAYARRHQDPLSVLMIDLDHFKDVNDRHGHDTGDLVLQAIAGCMHDAFRDSDVYGRWGGDEFLAILPSTDTAGAHEAAERLRTLAAALDLTDLGLLPGGISLSIGCTTAHNITADDLVSRADATLYHAKRSGRGRVMATNQAIPNAI